MRESREEKKKRAEKILKSLRLAYPGAKCALNFSTPWELLVATILSAQCTDKRVNMVTPALFQKFPTVEAVAAAPPAEIEELVKSTNFFRNKAKNIVAAAKEIVGRHGGRVPDRQEDLIVLPGVGRKTANVVLGNAYGIPGLTVDTHMIRVNGRLGLTRQKDPVKIEMDLMPLIPQKYWTEYSHLLIEHGRIRCFARKPDCPSCVLRSLCPSAYKV